ncbi:MAG: tetratricopeptide repeat protein [Nitrospinaceae bacterium]
MKKVFQAIFFIAVFLHWGNSISTAQQEKSVEDNVNDMLQLLDELQSSEEWERKFSQPGAPASTPGAAPPQLLNDEIPPGKDAGNQKETVSGTAGGNGAPKESAPGAIGDSSGEKKMVSEAVKEAGDRPENTVSKKKIEAGSEVVRFLPNDPEDHFKLGLGYWRQKELSSAISEFQQVVQLDPENAHAFWNLGLLYNEIGEGEDAIINMRKSEELYTKYDYPEYALESRKRLDKFYKKYKFLPEDFDLPQ